MAPDAPEPLASPPDVGDSVVESAADVEWLELTQVVSASVPDRASELWLGQLVIEVQQASDRAVATARVHADSVVAEARAEAIGIREEGRRRAQAVTRLRAVMRHALASRPGHGVSPDLDLSPPTPHAMPAAPRVAPTRAAPPDDRKASESVRVTPLSTAASGSRDRPANGRRSASPAPAAHPTIDAQVDPRPTVKVRSGRGGDGVGVDGPGPPTPTGPGPSLDQPSPPKPGPPSPSEAGVTHDEPGGGLPIHSTAILAAVAIVASVLGLALFEHYGTAARERGSQQHLAAEFATVAATRSTDVPPTFGAVFGLLSVPRLGINGQAVVEGTTLGHLRRGPAHDAMSPRPGQQGAVVILGHRRTYGGPFAHLGQLRPGDVASLRTTAGLFVYRVSRDPQVLQNGSHVLQLPSAVEVRASGGGTSQVDQALVLATGVGSGGTAIQVVVATLDQASTASPASRATSSDVSAQLRSVPGERVGLLLVLLWSAALGGIIYLGGRLRSRLPGRVVFATSSLVTVLLIYQVYLAVDRMLPGTY